MKHCLVVFMLLLVSQTYAGDSQKVKDIKTLLKLTGSVEMSLSAMDQIIESLKKVQPDIPEEFWSEFRKEVSADDLIDLIVPIYNKYYSEQDVKDLIVFYKSPLGQKVTKTLPSISQESMQAGQVWGQRLGEKVVERMKAKGYLKE
jgi:hypothetical protein